MNKCAIYTRVSTEMQANKEFNSCEAQRERIMAYIRSQPDLEFYKEYSDPGYSGGDLTRPGLNALLQDIKQHKIDRVLTYKIDRLTRSSKDFYNLIEYFDQNGAAYVSVTEQFDTSSPSGRLLRNIMLTFAQFERELLAERIRDKRQERSIKGMWNGGNHPMGYQIHNKKLIVDRDNADIVRKIFEDFASHGSMKRTTDFVQRQGFSNPITGNTLQMSTVSYMLRNVAYAGKTLWEGKIYEGQHEPLVPQEVFSEVQALLKEKVRKKRLYKEFLFKGMIKCGECGSTMTNAFTNKKAKRYHYYKCYKVVREGRHACGIKEVNAEKLEAVALGYLGRLATDTLSVENLAFRLAHEFVTRQGEYSNSIPVKSNELLKSCTQEIKNRIQNTLEPFKIGEALPTQTQNALLVRNAIESVRFSRDNVELTLSAKGSLEGNEWNELIRRQTNRPTFCAGGRRRGSANLTQPYGLGQSSQDQDGCPKTGRLNQLLEFLSDDDITMRFPHELLNRCKYAAWSCRTPEPRI